MNEQAEKKHYWTFRKLDIQLEGACPHCGQSVLAYFEVEEDNE
jgi:hypothetical protein